MTVPRLKSNRETETMGETNYFLLRLIAVRLFYLILLGRSLSTSNILNGSTHETSIRCTFYCYRVHRSEFYFIQCRFQSNSRTAS
ncbi:MAG: hypothetical protein ACI9G1_001883, partial [Pirellulaceae bacterium]